MPVTQRVLFTNSQRLCILPPRIAWHHRCRNFTLLPAGAGYGSCEARERSKNHISVA